MLQRLHDGTVQQTKQTADRNLLNQYKNVVVRVMNYVLKPA